MNPLLCWTVGRLEAKITKTISKIFLRGKSYDYNEHYDYTLPC
jgi:hypothetical protein|nr:hypothetical protein AUSP0034_00042 [uncultured phage]